jgi:hypothetical protein
MAVPCGFLFNRFDEDIWQLLVEGEVEHDGPSPSVRLEWLLIAVTGLCWLCGWIEEI